MWEIVDRVGYHGPHLISIITLSQIWQRTIYLWGFLAGYGINKVLNENLKMWFREPRPQPMDLFQAQKTDFIYQLRSPFLDPEKLYVSPAHQYGMPSGHAQNAAYAATYLVLTNAKAWATAPFTSPLALAGIGNTALYALTMYQRWASKSHTVAQLAVGTIVGILFSIAVFNAAKYAAGLSLHRALQK